VLQSLAKIVFVTDKASRIYIRDSVNTRIRTACKYGMVLLISRIELQRGQVRKKYNNERETTVSLCAMCCSNVIARCTEQIKMQLIVSYPEPDATTVLNDSNKMDFEITVQGLYPSEIVWA